MKIFKKKKCTFNILLTNIFIKLIISRFLLNNVFLIFRTIKPMDNELINLLIVREGHHNYYHVSMGPLRSAEKNYNKICCATFFIDIFVKLAYNLKYLSIDSIKKNCI